MKNCVKSPDKTIASAADIDEPNLVHQNIRLEHSNGDGDDHQAEDYFGVSVSAGGDHEKTDYIDELDRLLSRSVRPTQFFPVSFL